MKRLFKIFPIILLLFLSSSVLRKTEAQVSVSITYQDFYDELSPYGTWIDNSDYGYVWKPKVLFGFRPYFTNGHWIWTDQYGWMWASEYDWGWAPFHYGRWVYEDYYGWLWVPGYEWAPAWVVWRSGNGYYGWAPLDPGFRFSSGASFGNYSPPVNYWCFVPQHYISSNNVSTYVSLKQNHVIIHRTTVIENYERRENVFVTGPNRTEAELYSKQVINPVSINESSRPGKYVLDNDRAAIYKPSVAKKSRNNFSPEKFETDDRSRGKTDKNSVNDTWASNSGNKKNKADKSRREIIEQRDNYRYPGSIDSRNNRQIEPQQNREIKSAQRNVHREDQKIQYEKREINRGKQYNQRNPAEVNNRGKTQSYNTPGNQRRENDNGAKSTKNAEKRSGGKKKDQ